MATDLPSRPLTRTALRELGVDGAELRRLVEHGDLRRVFIGVYVRGDLPESPTVRAACAATLKPRQVICDLTASWIWGVDASETGETGGPGRVDVAARDGARATRVGQMFGCQRALAPDDVVDLDGVLVTSPVRTACDVAMLFGRRRGLAVLDAMRRTYRIDDDELQQVVSRLPGRRGVVQLRELAAMSTTLSESHAESWVRLELHDAGMPDFEPQVDVEFEIGGVVHRGRLDLADRRRKVAVEYDGEEFHSSPEHQAWDRDRREALRRDGWIIIVVRREGLSRAGCERWLADVRAALRERAPAPPSKRRYSKAATSTTSAHRRGHGRRT